MYFLANEGLGQLQPVCEAAAYNLEKLTTSLKMFKKETEKTYGDPKRLKALGTLIVADAQDLADRLADYIDGGCCEEELKTLEAQVQALPWIFQKASGTKVVRIEKFVDIVAAHRKLIEAIRGAQRIARSHLRCDTVQTRKVPGAPSTTKLAESPSTMVYVRPFDSAERDITESDAGHILTILGGPSPWQQYLQPNLAAYRKTLPAKPLRICDASEFVRGYSRIFGESPPVNAQGFVDRRNGIMVLKEFPSGNRGKTKVGLALHEAVHLFSHPPGKSNQLRATSYGMLDRGLIEGITQVVTEDILAQQGISPLRERWQVYESLTPIARRFMNSFSPMVAEAYFNGRLRPLINAIQGRWTVRGLQRVIALANQQQTIPALDLIGALNQAPRVTPFQQVFR
jgi:hypothetical protein